MEEMIKHAMLGALSAAGLAVTWGILGTLAFNLLGA